jgi:hypothetical protein
VVPALRRRVGREGVEGSIAWIRLLAAPFILLDAATEEFPPGDERWAWAITATFAAGAIVLFAAHRRTRQGDTRRALGAAGLVFDTGVLSAWAVLYAFDPGTPARELLVLVVVEAALRYGPLGALWSLATIPALALFERRLSDALDLPFDPGHAVFPAGLYLLVGLVVGTLVRGGGASRARE